MVDDLRIVLLRWFGSDGSQEEDADHAQRTVQLAHGAENPKTLISGVFIGFLHENLP